MPSASKRVPWFETPEGLSPIEEIKPGDLVLARDEKTGEIAYRQVKRTFVTADQRLYELELKDAGGKSEKFGVTGEHPFWVKERGWVGAADLLPGDEDLHLNRWLAASFKWYLAKRTPDAFTTLRSMASIPTLWVRLGHGCIMHVLGCWSQVESSKGSDIVYRCLIEMKPYSSNNGLVTRSLGER